VDDFKVKTNRHFRTERWPHLQTIDQTDQPRRDPVGRLDEQKNARLGSGDFPGTREIKIAR